MRDHLMQRWGISWREMEEWTCSQTLCLYAAIRLGGDRGNNAEAFAKMHGIK